MIHAKTAVADGVWTRVGSSNLNLASLMTNWELDLAILDRTFASEMEKLFLDDLSSAVEITLPQRVAETGRRALVRTLTTSSTRGSGTEHGVAREARKRARRGTRIGRIVSRVSRASIVLA